MRGTHKPNKFSAHTCEGPSERCEGVSVHPFSPGVESNRRMIYICRMTKAEIIEKLKRHADAVRGMGATALYLYGSTARDQTGETSDLDLFIDYDPASRFNAFDLVGIKLFLEERLRLPVDITTRDSLHPRLRARIERSATPIF